MYKFSNQLSNAKLVLIRKQIGDAKCSAVIVLRAPLGNRRYSQYNPDKSQFVKSPPKSRKLLLGTIGATVLTGAAVVYAKHSPDARNWLESNAPWANNFVALVYQENTTYWKFFVNQFNKTSTTIGHFVFGKEGVAPPEIKSLAHQDLEKDAHEHFKPKDYQLPPTKFEPLYHEELKTGTPEIEQPATLIQTEKCVPPEPVPIVITKDLVELEHDMHENTKIAIDNYKQAIEKCAKFNKAVYTVVELPLEDLEHTHFTAMRAAQNDRDRHITLAKEAAAKAKLAIDAVDRLIQAGVKAPPESIFQTKRYLSDFRRDIAAAEKAYNVEVEKSVLSDRYWTKVEAARKMFKDELQAMFPGIDITARKLELKGDTDLLLLYTMKQIQLLQNELAELQTIRELKISRAVECHDDKALIEAKAEDIVKREAIEKERAFQKKSLFIQAEANRKLKEQLKKQYEIQQEVLQDKLASKEKEVLGRFSREVSEQVERERVIFKKELAAMAGKLSAIEQTLKQRAKAEEEARRSQSLWAAAEALLATTRRTGPETKIENEINALEKAGKGDYLVQTILNTIPKEVREGGIASERTLHEKFEKMEKTARKVALIGREGASLPVYFLSWLQSKLMFHSFAEIPKRELDNLPVDFTELDTFDIMHRARYYMDHGNLATALRYVNLLQGAPRAAAKTWVEATRRHLEIKQAAEAVMAHASVSGLLYL